ncbi:hypothetical protein BC629DRAFT_267832 [Irpex lacteus]|nr:hypothetical protein BC629DRAFT_267832 [Irpex lacteus]
MSGKAPPRAPRALLHTFQPSGASTQAGNPSNPRLGATPPTGPRSLVNQHRAPPQGPKAFLTSKTSHPPQPNGSHVPAPPSEASAKFMSHKGKQVDLFANSSQSILDAEEASSYEVKCSYQGARGSAFRLEHVVSQQNFQRHAHHLQQAHPA